MKYQRLISLLLALLMIAAMAGCVEEPKGTEPWTDNNTTPTGTVSTQPGVTVGTDPAISEPNVTEPDATEPDVSEPEPTEPQPTDPEPTEPEPTDPEQPKPVEITPQKITASVQGSFTVGDTLKQSDFTVKVTMSDGSVLTDPSGWTADPMKLTSTSNKITVTYKGLTATVTVKAELGAINGMDLAKDAISYMGLAYVDGGNSLTKGTDCSGFTKLIFAKYGITLPRTPSAQNKVGTIITAGEAKPGDLVVVTYPENHRYDGHAGIYIGGGNMVSAMPGDGVVVEGVHSGMDYIRVYDNCYMGTDEDAFYEALDYCVSMGNCGVYGDYGRCVVDWNGGNAVFTARSPLEVSGSDNWNTLKLQLYNTEPGFESLMEAWKKQHLAYGSVIIYDDEKEVNYGYWNGKWYLGTELDQMVDAGEISEHVRYETIRFYGAFWNSNAVITNGLGELVELSTCPYIKDYSRIARPGDPKEGEASRRPYDLSDPDPCEPYHDWSYVSFDGGRIRTCNQCGYTLKDYASVLDHDHLYERTFYRPTWIEEGDSGPCVIYSCLTCAYSYEVPLDPVKGENHDHDGSYITYTVEPTCVMDGYTYHECDCGYSYKDNYVQAEGHDYGETTTVAPTADRNGYDVKECKECGHKHKDNYKEGE